MTTINLELSIKNHVMLIIKCFLGLMTIFALDNAYANRLKCPSLREKNTFQDLVKEVIERDLNGYRVLDCTNTKQFYKYLSNQDLKFEDSERPIDSKKIIRVRKSDTNIKINRVSSSDIGEIHVSYTIQTKVKGKKVRSEEHTILMLSPEGLPANESCADVVGLPRHLIVYDICK
ncbi:MAG: hypothetical protein KDD34_00495 [Bdellovibrionales bacterium]|nr:hypothetical protein [Bdellovibrionales bacterium]